MSTSGLSSVASILIRPFMTFRRYMSSAFSLAHSLRLIFMVYPFYRMCGDGANDAPALRQAQIGIAVSTATDVAKSAAGVVLTESGLGGIVSAVKEGRITFQRILTYTLNSVLKKIVQVLLLAIGLVMTGHAVLTPMLMVI